MNQVPWFFIPGTERRQAALRFQTPGVSLAIPCHECGRVFEIGAAHGTVIELDGAVTTDHAFTCPRCRAWTARIQGGVVYTFVPSENVE